MSEAVLKIPSPEQQAPRVAIEFRTRLTAVRFQSPIMSRSFSATEAAAS